MKRRLRYFENSPYQQHITDRDRYLYAVEAPEFRVNVIGTGTIGQEHMRVATLLGEAAVHGIFDTSAHSLDVAERNFKTYSDRALTHYDDLQSACTDPAVDGLILCTPNHTHLEVLETALQSAKPLLLEKPMATTLADAARIVALAADYPAPIQVGLQYRYKVIYAEAIREVFERRSLGEPITINILEHRPAFLDKVGQWNKFSRYSGGTLIEKCCHYFDLMNLFAAAPPVRVFASGAQTLNFTDFERDGERSDIIDNAFVLVEFANGVRGNFSLNMFAPSFREEMIICGAAGRLQVSEAFDFLREEASHSEILVEHDEPAASRHTVLSYPQFIERSGHHGATYFEHQAFVEHLRGHKVRAATVEQGFWSIVVGAAADESLATGQPVDIAALLAANGLADVATLDAGHWS